MVRQQDEGSSGPDQPPLDLQTLLEQILILRFRLERFGRETMDLVKVVPTLTFKVTATNGQTPSKIEDFSWVLTESSPMYVENSGSGNTLLEAAQNLADNLNKKIAAHIANQVKENEQAAKQVQKLNQEVDKRSAHLNTLFEIRLPEKPA